MVILFGAAGSGKSLQGQTLADKYDWRWMSIGQLLRECKDPELDAIMKKGELVPDDFVVKMMHGEMMKEVEAGRFVILDGYPRDQWQADWIVENGDEKYLDGAIILDVDHDELWRRLTKRGRADDTREAIEKRWSIFEQTIYSMTETLEKHGVKVIHIDGVGAVEEITERIENVLREWNIIDVQESETK
ncbi:MAG: nucleoside monophosphate kinase [Candidatus Saccharibacteria bacterium]|nr:nucleoside monophosphate kinase [Candidatus Saccharibacteria bacterium]